MKEERTLVLNHINILQKMRRMAYEIYEFNYDEKELVFVAIETKGIIFAERLKLILEDVSGIKIKLFSLAINKKRPLNSVNFQAVEDDLKGKSVILIDDVLNSGKTLIYAAKHILDFPVKKLTTVVLVDRKHRKYPIKADFVGLSLSTTLQDHIAVEFSEGNDAVYLE